MQTHYGPSTRRRIGDFENGIRVETAVLDNDAYMIQVQTEVFTVYGRILVLQLYIEAITVFSADATTLNFSFTQTTPAIGVQPMTGQTAVLTSLAQGNRIVYVGGAVATAPVITGTAGISDVIALTPHIIGTATIAGTMGVGTIGQDTAAVSQASGTHQAVIYYAPMEDGAYVTSIL